MRVEAEASAHAEREALRALVPFAVLAPSKLNAQPWRFRICADRLDVLADRTRSTPASDPYDRQLTIGCGSALMNARVAARRFGRVPNTTLLPDASEPDLVASLSLGAAHVPNDEDCGLFDAVPVRRTYRKAFADREVDEALVSELVSAAEQEGAWLHIARGAERDLVVNLVYEGDRLLWRSPAWRRELAAWMHPRRVGDGIPVPDVSVEVAVRLVRTFDMGGGEAARHEDLARGSPVLAVLGSNRDDRQSWMQAGQAVERVLLAAASRGLLASFLNQPAEVPAMRWRLAEELGRAGHYPHVILRLGFPTEDVPPAPRRDLWTVVEEG